MRDYQRGPIIIKLKQCMNERAEIAKVMKKRLESLKTSAKKRSLLEHNSRKKHNVYMMSECDDELKNDFKWLINFNLKEIHIYDIDEELPGSTLLKGQKNGRGKKGVKHKHRLPLSDVIEECLFIKNEATIKEINKWISDAFPCFKSNGCTWKNSVRKTLLNNPIFKKRKLIKGYLWCLDENYLRDSSYVKATLHQSAKSSISENDLLKPISSKDFKELTTAIQAMQESTSTDENTLNETDIHSIPANITQMHLSTTWIESKELHVKHCAEVKDGDLIEYYEMSPEFQDENEIHFLDENEIHLLDENNMLIPIDLI